MVQGGAEWRGVTRSDSERLGVKTSSAQFDVVIVGYGPTGVTLANLLGQAGVSVAVVERDTSISTLPRAIACDGEIVRVFETLGLAPAIVPELRPSGRITHLNAAGELLLERRPLPGVGPHGWGSNWLFHQPTLEAALRRGVARFPKVVVFEGHELVGIEQNAHGVSLDIVKLDTARHIGLSCRYAVGCDGGRSLVRQAMGSALDDLGLHQPWLVVDIELEPEREPELEIAPGAEKKVDLPEHTIQYCDPARPITYVRGTGNRRRWEIMLMPGDDPATMMEPAQVWQFLSRWVTPRDARLARGAVYTFHSLIATRWRNRRLLIAGDAAHQMPPFLGQGMCAGIRDAANLAWKLTYAVRTPSRTSVDALLDSYGTEREPHVRVYVEEAMRLGAIIQTTDPEVAAYRDRRFRDGGVEEMPHLAPVLGPGLHSDGPPAGAIFPQPTLDDGRRLDSVIDAGSAGPRFALLATDEFLNALDAHHLAALRSFDAALVPAQLPQADTLRNPPEYSSARWLAKNRAAGVLVRPDRYVLGLVFEPADVTRLAARLAGFGVSV